MCSKGIDRDSVKSILVVKTSSLGDIIHSFPALVVLKKVFPDSEFDFLVNPQFSGLLDYSPVPIREKIIYDRKKIGSIKYCVPAGIKLIRELRKRKYDLVIDFQGLLRSSIFAFFAGAVQGACGFAEPREKVSKIFYRHKFVCGSLHAVDRNVELVNGLFGVNYRVPDVVVPENSAVSLPDGVPEKYTLLLPGARWESKCFPVSLFTDIAKELINNGRKVVLAGSRDEENACLRIAEECGGEENVYNTAGKTSMLQLFELIRKADAVVCNDSGPLHIASIMDKNIFCFFGPTNPAKTGPWNSKARVYKSSVECAGCLKRVCPLQKTACHELDKNKIISDILNTETGL